MGVHTDTLDCLTSLLWLSRLYLACCFVHRAIHSSNLYFAFDTRSQLLPFWLKILTVATPRGIKLYQPDGVTINLLMKGRVCQSDYICIGTIPLNESDRTGHSTAHIRLCCTEEDAGRVIWTAWAVKLGSGALIMVSRKRSISCFVSLLC